MPIYTPKCRSPRLLIRLSWVRPPHVPPVFIRKACYLLDSRLFDFSAFGDFLETPCRYLGVFQSIAFPVRSIRPVLVLRTLGVTEPQAGQDRGSAPVTLAGGLATLVAAAGCQSHGGFEFVAVGGDVCVVSHGSTPPAPIPWPLRAIHQASRLLAPCHR